MAVLLKALSGASLLCGSAIAYASGSSFPPKELLGRAEVRCGFAQAELQYLNRWDIKQGHHALIETLAFKKGGAASPSYQEKLDQLTQTHFSGQERIEGITASCYEDRLIIFNVRYSALMTEAGKMRWAVETPLHITIGMDSISIVKSPEMER